MCLAIFIGPDEQTGHVGTISQGSGVFAIGGASISEWAQALTRREHISVSREPTADLAFGNGDSFRW